MNLEQTGWKISILLIVSSYKGIRLQIITDLWNMDIYVFKLMDIIETVRLTTTSKHYISSKLDQTFNNNTLYKAIGIY